MKSTTPTDEKFIPILHAREGYLAERAAVIHEHLANAETYGIYADKSSEFLDALSENQFNFTILAIDIVNSTLLANTLDPKKYLILTSSFLYEVGQVVAMFHAHVLKHLGDGLIAYFYHPESKAQTASVIQCAEAILDVIDKVLNPAYVKFGLPTINVRVGIDSGMAYVTTVGSPDTKRHSDLVGNVVNMTMKIQSLAGKDSICVGEEFNSKLEGLHDTETKTAELPVNWKYKDKKGEEYKVYHLTKWKRFGE